MCRMGMSGLFDIPSGLLLVVILASMSHVAQAVPRVLVYTATAGYRHDSIPTAIQVLGNIASRWNVSFAFSEDRNMFTVQTLSTFDGVMFVSNSDDVLDSNGQAALKKFFQSGGVYCGVHAASACLQNDTNYQQAVGAIFDYHPTISPSPVFVRLNTTFPATANVPDRWSFEEEVYQFRSDPRSNGAVVIMTVDGSSYTNDGTSTGSYPSQGTPHPIAWYTESPKSAQPLLSGASKAGRSFYTSLGHLNSTWQNETFQTHVMAGLRWALDGASTKAYGQGLVGNAASSAGGSNASTSASGASSTSNGGSATQAGASSATTSRSAGQSSAAGNKGAIAAAMAAGAGVVAGVAALA